MARDPKEIQELNEAKVREAQVNKDLATSNEELAKAQAELDAATLDSLKNQIELILDGTTNKNSLIEEYEDWVKERIEQE